MSTCIQRVCLSTIPKHVSRRGSATQAWITSAKTMNVTPKGVEALEHARFGATTDTTWRRPAKGVRSTRERRLVWTRSTQDEDRRGKRCLGGREGASLAMDPACHGTLPERLTPEPFVPTVKLWPPPRPSSCSQDLGIALKSEGDKI